MNINLMLTDSGTNPQRVLMEELGQYFGTTLYNNQDDAAAAVADELWQRSKDYGVEYCTMIYRLDLSLYGGYGYAYYSVSILKGMHDNVFLQLMYLQHESPNMRGSPVAFIHSHPHCLCHRSNDFSHGDKGVPAIMPSLNSVYLIGMNKQLQRWNKDGSEWNELGLQINDSFMIVIDLLGGNRE